MRFHTWLLGLLVLVPMPVQASGLTEVERTIRREPRYEGKPRYCLLVFGAEAKSRIWLVRAGHRLYVDKNGNGDLTEAKECLTMSRPSPRGFPIQLSESPEVELILDGCRCGKLQVTERGLHPEFKPLDQRERETWQRFQRVEGNIETIIEMFELAPQPRAGAKAIAARIRQAAGWDSTGALAFAAQPKNAPILHFDGPLTLGIADIKLPQWEKSGEDFDFQVNLGTPGLGKGTFVSLDYSHADAKGDAVDVIPQEVYPVAEVEFPAKAPGGKPVRVRWTLKQRC